MKYCENCGKLFDETTLGKYSTGRFCSRSCANTRHHTDITKKKISDMIKSLGQNTKNPSKKYLTETYSYKEVDKSLNIKMPIRTCVVCGKRFYHFADRKTCCKKCNKLHHDKLNKLQKGVAKVKYKTQGKWNADAYKSIYKYYFTYKTINLVNNKYYLGIHMTNNLNDGYLGSGKRLKQAICKYGRDKFKRVILNYYTCYKDLVDAEYNLISEDIVKDKQSYNLTRGGVGGPNFKGHKHSEKTKQLLREKRVNQIVTEETKKKISESQKGRKAWNKGIKLKK